MKKLLAAFAFALLTLPALVNAAGAADCYTTFYQSKNMQCVDSLLDTLRALKTAPGAHNNPAMVGFLGALFSEYPDKREAILKQDTPANMKGLYIEALYRGGLQQEAKTYADSNGFAEAFRFFQGQNLPPLVSLKPSAIPSDNDMLIGAYMASGNTLYIRYLLGNFTTAGNAMASDAFRIAMMAGKFGKTMAPQGRPAVMMQAACQRYKCKANAHDLMRVMTLASGFWALQSLSAHDAGIKKTFDDFFKNDKRLSQLFTVEATGFNNYLVNLTAFAAIKDNPKINASLTIYENLGSVKDAQDAMMGKTS